MKNSLLFKLIKNLKSLKKHFEGENHKGAEFSAEYFVATLLILFRIEYNFLLLSSGSTWSDSGLCSLGLKVHRG